MITTQFEKEWQELIASHAHGSFDYTNERQPFREAVSWSFSRVKIKEKFGVYVVRQKSTWEVLYVGKGGTINKQGFLNHT